MKDQIFNYRDIGVVRGMSDPVWASNDNCMVVVVDELVDLLGESKKIPLKIVYVRDLCVL